MPSCYAIDAEDSASKSNVSQGYIQLDKSKYMLSAGTDKDSSHACYVLSPALMNLDSIYVELSPDVTIQTSRKVSMDLEYSTDGGDTWSGSDDVWIELNLDAAYKKYGQVFHVNSKMSEWGLYFDEFVKASESGSIIIRFIGTDYSYVQQGSQRIKIHNIKIYATEPTSSAIQTKVDLTKISIQDNTIYTEDGSNLVVYNYMGQTIGVGNNVTVKSGIYIVRTESGSTRKVLVK
jgi:hypothetical protein